MENTLHDPEPWGDSPIAPTTIVEPNPYYGNDSEARKYLDELATPIESAIIAGNRVTLLTRSGTDLKKPLMKGFVDPTIPNWTLADFRSQAKWAVENAIEITGFGVVNGDMSAHRHVLDFDTGEKYEAIRDKINAVAGVDLDTLPRVRSGRTSSIGYHVIIRSTATLPTQVLAQYLDAAGKPKVIVELCGAGRHTVAPGSKHRSGNRYLLEHGDAWSPPIIPIEQLTKIVEVCRTFDELPAPPPKPPRVKSTRTIDPGESVIDAFHSRNSIHDVLSQFGYIGGGEWYRHPNNGGNERSVHVLDDKVAYFFSPNDPMGAGTSANAFQVYCKLRHHDDIKRAVKELAEEYGMNHPKKTAGPAAWESDADRLLGTSTPQSPIKVPDCLPASDLGNARRLVFHHGHEIRYVPGIGWHFWTGKNWQADLTGTVMRFAKRTVQTIFYEVPKCQRDDTKKQVVKWALTSESADKLSSMLTVASTEEGIVVGPDDLDADHWQFNVKNGTINLKTGILHEHAPEDRITKLSPIVFDATATCPTFDAFMSRIFDRNQPLIDYVLAVLGHTLTGDISLEHLWVMYGGGANGKSTLLGIVQHIMGEYSGTAPESLLTVGRDEHPTELADLQGKRLVIASETESNARLKLQLVKRLTGDSRIKARKMRQDFFEFQRTHKMVMMTNNKPRVREDSEAVWRRLRMIPFSVQIPVEERDAQLALKLKVEASGILNRLIEGCLSWQKNGLIEPPEVKHATDEYRLESDPIEGFMDDKCLVAPNAWTSSARLYQAYMDYCKSNGDYYVNGKAFGEMLSKRGFTPLRKRTGRGWSGVSLTSVEGSERTWDVVD